MPGFGSLAQTPDEPYPEEGAGMPEIYQSPAGRAMANIGIGLAKAIWDIPRKLGQAAEVPAGLRREDVTDIPVRRGITGTAQFGAEPQDELIEGTTGSAINRIGTGLPFAPRGVGVFGGKLAKPVEAVQGEAPHQSPYAGWHEAMEGIKAYHGSPHDFDKFDISKIGTGEGAQAYGHGLYFAEHEPVARQYRDQLQWKGANFDDPQVLAQNAIDRNGSREAAANSLQSSLDSINRFHRGKPPPSQAAANAQTEQAIALLRSNEPITGKPNAPGHMYEVNIEADPEHFLDWDKPVSQQSEVVRKALAEKAWADQGATADDLLHVDVPGEQAYKRMITGQGGTALPGLSRQPQAISATDRLREAGIPGIKYLDQGSRGVPTVSGRVAARGDGKFDIVDDFGVQAGPFATKAEADQYLNPSKRLSHNYVVFDDKLIDILRKYGWAGLVGSAGLLGGKDPSKEM